MAYLADTNVAIRLILPLDPRSQAAIATVATLRRKGEVLYITAQILVEFQAIATRPISVNGLGMSPAQASLEARKLEAIFPLLPETPAIYPQWRALVDQYAVAGKQVHDTRIVAVMLVHGVTHLLTMNAADFRRFAGIRVVTP